MIEPDSSDRKQLLRIVIDAIVIESVERERIKLLICWADGSPGGLLEIFRPPHFHRLMWEQHKAGIQVDEIVKRLLARGVLIRSLRSHRVRRSLVRVSVGEPEDNRRFVRAFGEIVRGSYATSERSAQLQAELPVP